MLTRRGLIKSAAALVAAGTVSGGFTPALAKAPLQSFQAPGFYRMKLGSFELTALSDGTIPLPLPELYTNTDAEDARRALAAAFMGTSTDTSVNAFLVNTGERLVLIDAGTGAYLDGALGDLVANLEAAGYKADQIDDIILTHIHTDHSGGLTIKGKPVFANATVHVNKREHAFWMETPVESRPANVPLSYFVEAHESLGPYADAGRVRTFADNASILPGIGSILRAGHTPGHSSIVVESAGAKIVFWGDVTHGNVLQFDEPDVAIQFDTDQSEAICAREAAFADAANGKYLVAGAHIAFPGIGHVRRDATNYEWVPVNYAS
ncbi:MBL fold metallo-hydrolase [Rhizobium bangladeshense]|uniref:MBL fold metallo-hydrolase n=1 Tax=Rhizobium bangladeshense TaxID=1138189 RepID=UPI001A9A186B|nr:MBL fold metallo-hydrolase [Rhizobium bangladeshense]MBX4931446.1 MBL fold metallo-hydrolase [Rhizobium bangladeshense]MBY3582377.1 MBL fold metallo-hydrolase [Rhizobium bangladeshense]QSY90208.1 MBL fold metallo-hydrolase [Rhizobium bangladeshense]